MQPRKFRVRLGAVVAVVAIMVCTGQSVAVADPPPSTSSGPPGEKWTRHTTKGHDKRMVAAMDLTIPCENTRRFSCYYETHRIEQWVKETPSSPPRMFGLWEVQMVLQGVHDARQRTVTYVQTANITMTLPETIGGVLRTAILEERTGGPFPGQELYSIDWQLLQGKVTRQVRVSPTVATVYSDVTNYGYLYDTITLVPPENPGPIYRPAVLKSRCDGAQEVNYGTGCVNPTAEPVIVFDHQVTPFVAGHIEDATTAGAPGWFLGGSAPLTRTTTAQKKANNQWACSTSRINQILGAKPDQVRKWSCDEYPFASSKEGGQSAYNSIRWVPLEENTKQGHDLIDFFRIHRVMVGDEFYVATT